jgi:hypothetical protein
MPLQYNVREIRFKDRQQMSMLRGVCWCVRCELVERRLQYLTYYCRKPMKNNHRQPYIKDPISVCEVVLDKHSREVR